MTDGGKRQERSDLREEGEELKEGERRRQRRGKSRGEGGHVRRREGKRGGAGR